MTSVCVRIPCGAHAAPSNRFGMNWSPQRVVSEDFELGAVGPLDQPVGHRYSIEDDVMFAVDGGGCYNCEFRWWTARVFAPLNRARKIAGCCDVAHP